jgi:hypothetical protein
MDLMDPMDCMDGMGCDRRRRLFARPGSAGVPPAPPGSEDVRARFTTSRGLGLNAGRHRTADAGQARCLRCTHALRPSPTAVRAMEASSGGSAATTPPRERGGTPWWGITPAHAPIVSAVAAIASMSRG